MQLSGLKQLYGNLKQHNENYYLFQFTKNKADFEVLFDIYPQPFQLIFLEKKSDFKLIIEVQQGFTINPRIEPREVFSRFCKVLGLQYDPNNKFSSKAFFEEFNSKIPAYTQRKIYQRELLPFYHSEIEEADKLYFDHFIEWNKNGSQRNVSEKNLEKTRILYPELYEKCRRENMSIAYSVVNKHEIS